MLKWTIIFVVCCIPVMIAFLSLVINAPFSKRAEEANTPDGATGYVMARADYDGNFYWTHDSKKYEYALEDYGLSPENYEFGDEVKVYVGVIGAILVPTLLLLCVYMPIAYHTFGKPWIKFYREFKNR